ncbi:MAG: aspartate carbamoyltransferase [Candidatus Njordarchaeota archaeon]
MNPFKGRDIIDILDFSREDFEWLFRKTDDIISDTASYFGTLQGQILACAFFEPSTRTRLSFEAAMKRLGGNTIGFSKPAETSIKKGEKFVDTLRMLDIYSDVIIIRHPMEGAAKLATEICEKPIINGGDGKLQHPTQTMLDLYTIYREYGGVDGLVVGVLGDLKYARTTNSLLMGLCTFKPKKIYLIAPTLLHPRDIIIDMLKRYGIKFELVENVEEIISDIDILYVVRIQKERFIDLSEYEKIKQSYRVTPELLTNAKETLKILHPLPKLDEIDPRIDKTKYALYFKQAKYGLYLRMALLHSILAEQ